MKLQAGQTEKEVLEERILHLSKEVDNLNAELKEKKTQAGKREEEASSQREQLNKLLEMINEKVIVINFMDLIFSQFLGPKDRPCRERTNTIEGHNPSFGGRSAQEWNHEAAERPKDQRSWRSHWKGRGDEEQIAESLVPWWA